MKIASIVSAERQTQLSGLPDRKTSNIMTWFLAVFLLSMGGVFGDEEKLVVRQVLILG
jgi:hypothetical protein